MYPDSLLKTGQKSSKPKTVMPDLIRHPLQIQAPKMDSRVKHGNDRKWGGVMTTCVIFKLLHGVIWHPSMKKVKGQKSKRRLKRALHFLMMLHLPRN